jgi:hypothetical protein
MRRIPRTITALVGLIAALGVIAVAATAVGAAGKGKSTKGTIWIASTPRSSNGLLYEAGQIKDKLLGEGAITFTIKPIVNPSGTFTAKALKVTLWTSKGSLSGTGSALITVTNTPTTGGSTASNGKVSLTKGTGGLKGHSFTGKFSGTGNVNGATYTFKYTGTYK